MAVALYARVSTQEQAKEGYSIDEQVNRLSAYAGALGIDNYKPYVDGGFSGGNTDRPALQEMISDVKAGRISKVIVYKLDRLSRSQLDTLYLIEKVFLANNCDFISMSENFDTSSPFGKAMIGILAVFAQLEREQIKERLLMGRTARAKEGLFHGGNGAIGYEYIDGKLIINEFEAIQIKEIYKLYLSGNTFSDIKRIFDERGYKTRFGKWSEKRIRSIILNDLYAGKITFSGEKYDGVHTPIIDMDTFQQAQAKHRMHYKEHIYNTKTPTNEYNLLGGLIYCGYCGAKYCCTYNNKKKYAYYSCYSRRKINKAMVIDPECKNKNYRADKLNQMVLDEIRKLKLEKDRPETKEEDFRPAIKNEIKKLEGKRAKIIDLYSNDRITLDEFDSRIDPINNQIDKLKTQLLNPPAAIINQHYIKTFDELIKNASLAELRIVVQSLIQRIIIRDDDIRIIWNI